MNEINAKEITFDEIRAAIKGLTDSQKETDRQLKENAQQHEETKRLMREGDLRVDRQFEKSAQQLEETKRLMRESAIETERLRREGDLRVDRQFEKSAQQLEETKRLMREGDLRVDRQFEKSAQQLEETKRLMREGDLRVDRQFEKSAQQLEETKRLMREGDLRVDRQFEKSAQQLEETKRLMQEGDLRVDRQFEKSAQQLEKTGVEINQLNGSFGNQWGKFIESLVEGDLVKLLNERNIKVEENKKRQRGEWQGKEYEFDIFSINSDVVVVTEVKSTLKTRGVNYFLDKLERFKDMFPKHKDKTVYGAVAYLCVDDGVDRYAEKHGLIVIRATGSSASIINKVSFVPVKF